jgi:ArsR family transcriptional regulator, arsenate/arsenite/antimonite-responsive transcriptional repressor
VDDTDLALCLAALAQPSRLAIVRLLGRHKDGVAVHMIAAQLKLRQNAVSFHLAVLAQADLVVGHRIGRMILYRLLSRKLKLLGMQLDRASGLNL